MTTTSANTSPTDFGFGIPGEDDAPGASAAVLNFKPAAKASESAPETKLHEPTTIGAAESATSTGDLSSVAGTVVAPDAADAAPAVAPVVDPLVKLAEEKATAMKALADKFAKKEFDLRRKSGSMSERKTVAFDAVESMRQLVRDQLSQPYMDDAEVDVLIKKAFDAGLASVTSN